MHIANLPLDATVQFMTIMATRCHSSGAGDDQSAGCGNAGGGSREGAGTFPSRAAGAQTSGAVKRDRRCAAPMNSSAIRVKCAEPLWLTGRPVAWGRPAPDGWAAGSQVADPIRPPAFCGAFLDRAELPLSPPGLATTEPAGQLACSAAKVFSDVASLMAKAVIYLFCATISKTVTVPG